MVKIVSIALDIQGTEEQVNAALELIGGQEWCAGYNVVSEETFPDETNPGFNPEETENAD